MGWPTTSNPRTEFVTLRLTADEAAELDAMAAAYHHKNRSAALRHCFERCRKADAKKAKSAKSKRIEKRLVDEED